jgi:hypothetical protein
MTTLDYGCEEICYVAKREEIGGLADKARAVSRNSDAAQFEDAYENVCCLEALV